MFSIKSNIFYRLETMIFDDISSLSEAEINARPRFNNSKANLRTSLDDFLSKQREEIDENSDSRFYDVYQIQINQDLLANFKSLGRPKPHKPKQEFTNIRKGSLKADKNRNCDKNTGLKRESFHSNTESSDDGSDSESSNSASIDEFEASLEEVSHNKQRNVLNSRPSIEDMLEVKLEDSQRGIKNCETKSLVMPNRFRHIKTHLRRIKSSQKFIINHSDLDSNVKIESFVSLNDIRHKKKPIKAEDEICSICLSGYHVNTFIAKLKVCGHVFHKICIDEWINKPRTISMKCPLCKKSL